MSLLNRGSVSRKTFNLQILVEPGQQNVAQVQLDSNVLCIEELEWCYSVDSNDRRTLKGGYGWPKHPLAISIDNCCSDETSSPVVLSPPVLKRAKVEVAVSNPSAVPVTLNLKVKGQLAIGAELSDEEIIGYCMLDDNARGMLALQNAANYRLGASSAPTAPELTQTDLKALSVERDPNELRSLLIGDIVQSEVKVEQMIKLAEYLIQQGWSK